MENGGFTTACSLLSLLHSSASLPTGCNSPDPLPEAVQQGSRERHGSACCWSRFAPPAGRCSEPSGTEAEGIGYQSSVGGERTTRTTLTRSAHGCTVSQ